MTAIRKGPKRAAGGSDSGYDDSDPKGKWPRTQNGEDLALPLYRGQANITVGRSLRLPRQVLNIPSIYFSAVFGGGLSYLYDVGWEL